MGNTTKNTENNKGIAKTSIAVRRDFKNPNGEYDTDYFDLVAFQHQAEFLTNYIHKGDKILISGRMQTRTYVASDGMNRKVYEIILDSVENLTPKQKQELEQVEDDEDFAEVDISDDDIPF